MAGEAINAEDMEALKTAVEAVIATTGNSVVVLRADSSVPYGLSVRVMDVIKQAGAERIAIATGN